MAYHGILKRKDYAKIMFGHTLRKKTSTIWHGRKRRRLVMAAGLALLLIAVATIVRLLNEPSQGHPIAAQDVPKSLLDSTNKPQQAAPSPAATLSNDYFDLPLPPGYEVQADNQPATGMLYDQTLIKSGDFGSLIIALALQPLPAGGLAGNSSYQLRTSQPGRFQMTSRTVRGDSVRIASDNQGGVVAFWPHGGYLATISVSSALDEAGGDNSGELAPLQPLLAAWQWR